MYVAQLVVIGCTTGNLCGLNPSSLNSELTRLGTFFWGDPCRPSSRFRIRSLAPVQVRIQQSSPVWAPCGLNSLALQTEHPDRSDSGSYFYCRC